MKMKLVDYVKNRIGQKANRAPPRTYRTHIIIERLKQGPTCPAEIAAEYNWNLNYLRSTMSKMRAAGKITYTTIPRNGKTTIRGPPTKLWSVCNPQDDQSGRGH